MSLDGHLDEIETEADNFIGKFKELRQQRDELLAALKDVHDSALCGLDTSQADHATFLKDILEEAEEAIAKAEGSVGVESFTYVEFLPQRWEGDYAVEAERLGPTAFAVPTSELDGIEPCTHEADRFKDHDNAPQWVQDWDGPFEVDWFVDEEAIAKAEGEA